MAKLVLGLLVALAGIIGWYLKWRFDPERQAEKDAREKEDAHQAIDSGDATKLGKFWRKRMRK